MRNNNESQCSTQLIDPPLDIQTTDPLQVIVWTPCALETVFS